MNVEIVESADVAGARVTERIEQLVNEREMASDRAVLGLAAGHSPLSVYRALAARRPDLSRTVTFNLDEYWPVKPKDPISFHRVMREALFDHVNLKPSNTHLPNGTVRDAKVPDACAAYEKAIRDAGGIDLQLLGIGSNGHIAFNEPGSHRKSRTRRVELAPKTIEDNGLRAPGDPRHAITMGIATILEAIEIHLLAFGEKKAEALRRAFREPPTSDVPASFLQGHPNVTLWLDEAAAAGL